MGSSVSSHPNLPSAAVTAMNADLARRLPETAKRELQGRGWAERDVSEEMQRPKTRMAWLTPRWTRIRRRRSPLPWTWIRYGSRHWTQICRGSLLPALDSDPPSLLASAVDSDPLSPRPWTRIRPWWAPLWTRIRSRRRSPCIYPDAGLARDRTPVPNKAMHPTALRAAGDCRAVGQTGAGRQQ